MEEQLITFETAKLAKEKGYLRDVTTAFDLDKHHQESYKIWDTWNGETDIDFRGDTLDEDEIDAPTQTLLQKWLREIHGIVIIPDYDVNHKEYFYWVITDGETRGVKRDNFKDFEDALEVGLKEGLSLIVKDLQVSK